MLAGSIGDEWLLFGRPTLKGCLAAVRIALDGDAALFADEFERMFQRDGLSAFQSIAADSSSSGTPPA